ncbi:MAG: hypothetical protein SFY92_02375 [Verrucomicrobiae bacterium]|nr:hypothetical protein [Verrucomicrobiae bacterium]
MTFVSPPLAAMLESRRTAYNQRFNLARRAYPDMDAEIFKAFLRETLDPLVATASHRDPGAIPPLVDAAYDVGLELIGKKLLGPHARLPYLQALWTRVFPQIMGLILKAPAPLMVRLSNAACQIGGQEHARCAEWLEALEQWGPRCENADQLQQFAQILAWRSGMAQFRESVLKILPTLPTPLMADVFKSVQGLPWSDVLAKLERNPWYHPSQPDQDPVQPFAGYVGGFRGSGGPFLHPPLARAVAGGLVLTSGGEQWALYADVFGMTHKRCAATRQSFTTETSEDVRVEGKSRVIWNAIAYDFSHEGTVSSVASNPHTLAVTLENSHFVWLYARRHAV